MRVKVGLIGAGGMGRRHLGALARDPRVEIAGVADTDEAAARVAADEFGGRPCRTVADLADLGVDAAYVTLPNAYHAAIALEAMDRGMHVFSEKPMATSLDAARRVAAGVRDSGCVYQVGFNRRFAPAYRYLKQEVAAGFVPLSANAKITDGDMLTPSWYINPALTGGFLYDCAVHMIDMVAWLVGPVRSVAALGRQSCYPDHDDIALLLRCEGERPVALTTCGHASWARPTERVELYGDHALLASEDMERARHTTREEPEREWQRFAPPDELTALGYLDEDRAFIDACLGAAPSSVTADDAFHSIAVIEAAYGSLRGGGRPELVRDD
ncbi:MAG: Gfo/Idh/MocA family oxidoreductase [Bacillati bacterium ANGP1]|uniref:Gfo/Idh/MocA family oxidoreductase n=1 Tax=Candidatus Segetimicrobium genomatis TaxID=2569760 RepID=A0A537M1N7_9BACT|nr:MAG: Gfo/Idh/MocA family oxidoreductase [Terrabacteria group bacterium ANGP1]